MPLSVLRNIFSVLANLSIHPTNIQVTNSLFQNVFCQASQLLYIFKTKSKIKQSSHTKNDYCKSNNYKTNSREMPFFNDFRYLAIYYKYEFFLCFPSDSLQWMFIAYSCFTLTVNNPMDLPVCFTRINHVESVQQKLQPNLCPL